MASHLIGLLVSECITLKASSIASIALSLIGVEGKGSYKKMCLEHIEMFCTCMVQIQYYLGNNRAESGMTQLRKCM